MDGVIEGVAIGCIIAWTGSIMGALLA